MSHFLTNFHVHNAHQQDLGPKRRCSWFSQTGRQCKQEKRKTFGSELKLGSNKSLAVQGMPRLHSLHRPSTGFFFLLRKGQHSFTLHSGLKEAFSNDVNADVDILALASLTALNLTNEDLAQSFH